MSGWACELVLGFNFLTTLERPASFEHEIAVTFKVTQSGVGKRKERRRNDWRAMVSLGAVSSELSERLLSVCIAISATGTS